MRFSQALVLALVVFAVPASADSRITVEVRGVEGMLAENVLAHLELARFAHREDLAALTVRRLFDAAPEQVGEALRPFGYYSPHVEATLARDGDRFVALLEIDPGEPVRLVEVDVRVIGPGGSHPRFQRLLAQSPLAFGLPLIHSLYDELRGELESTARSLGYFDHSFVRRTLEVDPLAQAAHVHLVLDTGERHRFGAVHFEQDILEPELVDRLVAVREGDPYDADLLIATQYALADSEYFANVSVRAGARDREARTVPVSIDAEAAPRQRLSYGFGYGTDTQLRLRGAWEVNRLNRRGHRTDLEVRVSEPLRQAVAHYIVPGPDALTDRLAVRAAHVDEKLADAGSRRSSIGVVHQRLLGEWQRNLFVDLLDDRTTLPVRQDLEARLAVAGIAFELLRFDDPVLPSEGHRLYGEIRGSHRVLGSPTDFARLHFGASRLMPLGEDWSLLVQGALGLGWVDDFDELPASQRFFAGGDESVRGYRYRELGATEDDGYKVGGRHMLTASVELRRALGDWVQISTFVDAGNAMRELTDGVEVAVGVGVHLITPLGRLRAELAVPVTESSSARLHLSIRPDL